MMLVLVLVAAAGVSTGFAVESVDLQGYFAALAVINGLWAVLLGLREDR